MKIYAKNMHQMSMKYWGGWTGICTHSLKVQNNYRFKILRCRKIGKSISARNKFQTRNKNRNSLKFNRISKI